MTGNRENGVADGRPGPVGEVVEVACDESGSDGENLTGGNTLVFAHASVRLSVESAAGQVREIRDRIRSPAEEYKANHLLREKHRAVLEWLLAPAGPLHGRAHVHLTEKTFFVVDRVVDLLLDDGSAQAVTLFREGPRLFGAERWQGFLAAANRLLRIRNDGGAHAPTDTFFREVDALRHAYPRTPVSGILERLAQARSRADSYRADITTGPTLVPVLNPLLPAIVATAVHWSAGGRTVRLVHDRQSMLTPERVVWIEETARRLGARLDGFRLVVAREDPRVQLADFLAGIGRKIASDELQGGTDPALTDLLRPYVGTGSVWGDERSWARLAPADVERSLLP
ncbi:hypothetical protein [Streptomyces resistomycificus]|uniref:DUF3800 domain-containing protein n=1 Tax=Streptomyces resistomycificus TaxID=67356 RepID=A0A0L8LWN1_9ACTN|nr:hypothetical protein [Streptomyces resistomycificus]KOG42588.1 hypothetical protein ADK37_05650 [Streptomyces resistomycificus]KUN92741.1 hypothetical protein AQJ84_32750 [Streptomyces resistomycificus]